MQCRSCATVLQPGALTCPFCGTSLSSDPSDSSSYGYSESSVPYIPYPSPVETPSVPSSQPSPPDLLPDEHPESYTNPQFYMGAPLSLDHFAQQFPGLVAQPPPAQPQHNGPSVILRTLLVILVVFLATGGGLVYYTLVIRPAQQQRTVPPLTATNPQGLYTQATRGTPLNLQNPFDWQTLQGKCTFAGNTLHATAPPALPTPSMVTHTSAICGHPSSSFDNFAFQTRVTITQGYQIELFFRISTLGSGYGFGVDYRGDYGLLSLQNANTDQYTTKIVASGSSSAINTGLNQSNLLTVVALGSTISLYVNKQHLASVNDSASSVGMISVAGENNLKGGSVDVAFSELQVWKL